MVGSVLEFVSILGAVCKISRYVIIKIDTGDLKSGFYNRFRIIENY